MDSASKSLRDTFVNKLNQYDDLRFFFYKNVLVLLKTLPSSSTKFLLDILLDLKPASNIDIKTLNDSIYQGQGGSKSKNSFMNFAKYKKAFSECWIMFLSQKMDQLIYVRILEILHSKVIPNLTDPTVLMDFLVDAYNSGEIRKYKI